MTDARLPEKWLTDRRLARLDDASFRSFAQALMWSVSNRTDGLIEPDDLALIPTFVRGSVPALVASGLWTALGHGWLITDFVSTQTSRSELEVLENARRRERHKKQRQRARAVEKPSGECDVPRDGPGGRSPGTTQEGQDRQGQEGQARTREVTPNGQALLCSTAECPQFEAGIEPWPNLCRPCAEARVES
ncbi:hypothetical protein NIIDNTM18_29790 [Mycolicibacterium litorale]|uniref:Uncharacterized protein n=1 Tax=Mycolicibacterium litorale TaxID=758802 RepID=A0A6S6P7V8_9MYCO|nr:hypothetical protein NIIDNTM18_29790 [Mycolicibacterium litorale]